MTPKEIREKRAALAAKIKAFNDKIEAEKRAYTAEETSEWTRLNADYDALTEPLTRAERLEAIDTEQRSTTNTQGVGRGDTEHRSERQPDQRQEAVNRAEQFDGAFRAWALTQARQLDGISDADRAAATALRVNPGNSEFAFRLDSGNTLNRRQEFFRRMSTARADNESRALTTQIGQTGGFTIAPLFNASIESAMLYYGPMLQTSEVIRTATGADLPFMTDNETTKTGSYVGENTAITTAEGVTISTTTLKSYRGTTNAILVPQTLFRDTGINLQQYLGERLGERLGRFINTQATTGTVGKVRGITARSTSGKTTASSTAITADELLDLCHSVDIAYRMGAAWMMHDSVALYLRKLKDGNGAYLWTSGFQSGHPDSLLGYPVFINNDMASSVATTNKTVLFGQLNRYKIRLVQDIRITTTDQRYWEYDQIGFAAYVDFDGDLIDAGTNPVKHMTQV